MRLNKISLCDKQVFDKYLLLKKHRLCAYSFSNIYIWRKLFSISWAIINDSLCVFFKDKIGVFLYLPPLSKEASSDTIRSLFDILAKLNKNPSFAHIDNVEEEEVSFYRALGYDSSLPSREYIFIRRDLEELKGKRFKSKRASYNYFVKNFKYTCQPISLKDRVECLSLYYLWAGQRKALSKDSFYCGMLDDSGVILKEAFNQYSLLGFEGILVRVKGKVKAFTFGFKLNEETFCILYEITDLTCKGLAQFIFAEFCSQLKPYTFINIMDDSGLDNLRRVKLSYYPQSLLSAYSIRRYD
ncbi:MAG: phosphatidylglycerol lysyltransferase domain-containing protein [Candidatus Omnitrophota bacterium]